MKKTAVGYIIKILLVPILVGMLISNLPIKLLSANDQSATAIPSGWFYSPTTTHYYKATESCLGWHSCKDWAIGEGGHLVTVNNQAEQDWLVSIYGGTEWYWIGFNVEESEGNWVWISGETPTYTNWFSGEPSNSGEVEHYALMNFAQPSKWKDGFEAAIGRAILERNDPPVKVYLPHICNGLDNTNCDAVDFNEPNDSSDNATVLGYVRSIIMDASIAPHGDEDWYSFIAKEESSGSDPIIVDIRFNQNQNSNFNMRVYKWEDDGWILVCGPSDENPQYPDNSSCIGDGEAYTESITDNIGVDDSTDYEVMISTKPSIGSICDYYQLEITVVE